MRPFAERWAPWVAGVVLLAGVGSYAGTRLAEGGASDASRPVRLDPAGRRVAIEFVRSAVARKNLARAWTLVAPELKRGMTLAEWRTGTIPVVPYPVGDARMSLSTVTSLTDRAQLDVTFLRAGGTDSFRLGLRRVGGRWLVSAWAPVRPVQP